MMIERKPPRYGLKEGMACPHCSIGNVLSTTINATVMTGAGPVTVYRLPSMKCVYCKRVTLTDLSASRVGRVIDEGRK